MYAKRHLLAKRCIWRDRTILLYYKVWPCRFIKAASLQKATACCRSSNRSEHRFSGYFPDAWLACSSYVFPPYIREELMKNRCRKYWTVRIKKATYVWRKLAKELVASIKKGLSKSAKFGWSTKSKFSTFNLHVKQKKWIFYNWWTKISVKYIFWNYFLYFWFYSFFFPLSHCSPFFYLVTHNCFVPSLPLSLI